MGFFKEFKEDLSQAVDELLPGAEAAEKMDKELETMGQAEEAKLQELNEKMNKVAPVVEAPVKKEEPVVEMPQRAVSDEVATITAGMSITGNIETIGSLEVLGTVNGDVKCNGKLVVSGTISGNAQAAEFFADNAKVAGEIVAEGTVKVGNGSVIVGNITATSAVIAGAIKGDIDVQGPVVVDTSAVVMGNIKSRSVQINNGAVIEGFCSQCYSDIDVQGLFK